VVFEHRGMGWGHLGLWLLLQKSQGAGTAHWALGTQWSSGTPSRILWLSARKQRTEGPGTEEMSLLKLVQSNNSRFINTIPIKRRWVPLI